MPVRSLPAGSWPVRARAARVPLRVGRHCRPESWLASEAQGLVEVRAALLGSSHCGLDAGGADERVTQIMRYGEVCAKLDSFGSVGACLAPLAGAEPQVGRSGQPI